MSLEVFKERILPMKDRLFRFAFRLLQNVQEAEDAVQDVMAGIWAKKEEWGQWRNLEAYCMIAARNTCLDRIRKKRILPGNEDAVLQIGSTDKDPYEKMVNKDILYRIRQCITTLPENQQMVIQLREIEGFSYNEIAQVLDLSLEQVKINLFRGRNAIKKSIIKEDTVWNNRK